MKSFVFVTLITCVFATVRAQERKMIQKTQAGAISISVDQKYFLSPKHEIVPRCSEEDNAGGLPDGIAPAHSKFSFYLTRPEFIKNPKKWSSPECTLRIIPLADKSVVSFVKSYSFLQRNSREVLSLYSKGGNGFGSIKTFPDWECADCNQYFHSKVDITTSSLASGFHYITSCRQEPTQLENGEVHFIFNAVSHDKLYYIYLDIPICHPTFPFRDSKLPLRTESEVAKYYSSAASRLNDFDNTSFWPPLDVVVSLFKSIRIEK